MKDVLGLAFSLKEERKCKIAILLNDEKIEGDPGITKHFDLLKAEYVDERDPKDVLLKISLQESWGPKDIQLLGKLDGASLVDVIDSLQGEHLRDVLKMCGRFFRSNEPDYAAFSANLEDAFRILAGRSQANRVKLALLGIRMEEPEARAK